MTWTKAGKPGWGAIIPFYNIYLIVKVAGRPGWWLILYFIPIVNIIIWLIVCIDVARNFGHGAGFGISALAVRAHHVSDPGLRLGRVQAGERLS